MYNSNPEFKMCFNNWAEIYKNFDDSRNMLIQYTHYPTGHIETDHKTQIFTHFSKKNVKNNY